MRQREDSHESVVLGARHHRGNVAVERRLHHGVGGQLRFVGRPAFELIEHIRRLEWHRCFRPQRSIVVKHGDAVRLGYEIGRTGPGDPLNEAND
jgi:hypothetical protein